MLILSRCATTEIKFKHSPNTSIQVLDYFIIIIFQNDKLGIVVRAECWSLLGNLMKHHFVLINCGQRLPEILDLLRRDLQNHNLIIQQKAAKAFELVALPLSSSGKGEYF